jgi:fructosamine-3-kinase
MRWAVGVQEALAARLGSGVKLARAVAGGDASEAAQLTLEDGRRVFVKTREGCAPDTFVREAEGLAWLREARALRVPQVLAVSDGADGSPPFLALNFLECGPRVHDWDVRLGRGLAVLHRAGAPSFGASRDGYVASFPQPNGPCDTFAEFWVTRRLEPQLRRALDAGLGSSAIKRGFERVFARIDTLVGPLEFPSRLHGDLWNGNVLADETGLPVLIDPAPYGGHREVDLAMMRLFGGFSERVYSAYEEQHPLSPGAVERIPLWQLYPLLVHVNLFAGSYVPTLERTLRAVV